MSEPTIYKPGAYKSPGIYKGACGVYNGRGVYNDGAGGGGGINEVEIDGKIYPVVKIGNLYWISENLDFKYPGLSLAQGYNTSTPTAYYYNNNQSSYGWNGAKYGLYYNRNALRYMVANPSIFPDGWRVSTLDDWTNLLLYVQDNLGYAASQNATPLKNPSNWNGGQPMTNETGFNAKGTGRTQYNYGWSWGFVGEQAYFGCNNDTAKYLNYANSYVANNSISGDSDLSCVRLCHDV